MPVVSGKPARQLTLQDLELDELADEAATEAPDKTELDDADPVLDNVRAAMKLGYAGVILCGSPGTGKTWYAQQLAVALSGNWEAVSSIQFHPSYQYEDFVFGYAPNAKGAFELRSKELVRICRDASEHPDITHVLVIDEISRTDVVRVFGETLTYLETDKRGQPFQTASGEELTIPRNLVFVATMNAWDKGVDELDVALERRFAQIDLEPSADVLQRLLAERGAREDFVDRLIQFFEELQKSPLEMARLGHAYFLNCTDISSANSVWELRLRPTLRRACRLEPAVLKAIEDRWKEVGKEAGSENDAPLSASDSNSN